MFQGSWKILSCSTLTYNIVVPNYNSTPLPSSSTACVHDADPHSSRTVDGSPASKCGTCWELQYNGQPAVYMVAVDNAAMIQLGGGAFDKFAGAAGKAKGSVDATAVQVDAGKCGLPAV